jgi:hypothetical protein
VLLLVVVVVVVAQQLSVQQAGVEVHSLLAWVVTVAILRMLHSDQSQ